ncbi:MAG: NTP transferase domain-containing protein [Planctomycetota bacterium]|nr:NTP transferase domain-containing protein [Planctomycetota bacterium]
MRIRGIIIAAGESSRLGEPKALLELHGRSILDRLHQTLGNGGCDEVLVVVGGSHREAVQQESQRIGIPMVVNQDPSDGPVSSIRTAISMPGHWDALLIHPVDVIGLKETDVSQLIEAARGDDSTTDAWVISYAMRRGHPVIVTRERIESLLEVDGPLHLRALLALPDLVIAHVVTDNPLVLEDVDDRIDWIRVSSLIKE